MALFNPFGSSSGGLLGGLGGGGLLGGGQSGTTFRPIIGISSNVLSASFAAQRAQSSLASLSAAERAQFNTNRDDPAFSLSLPDLETDDSINTRVRRIRESQSFVDLSDRRLNPVEGDSDRTALFALNIAFDRLRTLAELASLETTTDSTRATLEPLFQQGLAEVQDYLATVETDLLNLQFGSRENRVESSIGLGDNDSDFDGSLIAASGDSVLDGLTGTEQFTITISKPNDDPVDITVDLANITGDLTLNNIRTLINDTISAIQSTDQDGVPQFDDDGNPIPEFNTRFDVFTVDGRAGLQIDGILTEEVRLSAATPTPTVYVAGTSDPVDEDTASRARVVEVNNLTGTLTDDNVFSFAGTDVDASQLAELTAEAEEDDVDPAIAERRDQFLADSLAAVQEANGTTPSDDDEEEDESLIGSVNAAQEITDLVNDTRVQAETTAGAVAVDSQGNLLVVGTSTGAFGNQLNDAEGDDVYLTKLDTQGNVIFARLLGSATTAEAFDVTVDAEDNIVVTGQTDSPVAGTDVFDGTDAFVTKFAANGDEQFRFQLDSFATSSGLAVTTDSNGDIFVGGRTSGSIGGGTSSLGGGDGFVLRLDGSNGTIADRTITGTSGLDRVVDIAVDASGAVVIAAEENGEAVLRKLDAANLSSELASGNLGSLGTGGALGGLTIDSTTGAIFVSGTAGSDADLSAGGSITPGGTAAGGLDGFVAGFTDSGTSIDADFSTRLGSSGTDRVVDIVSNDGKVFIAGTTTDTLAGETSVGATDGFLARFDATTGALEDQQQFGSNFTRFDAAGAAFTTQGDSVLTALGLPGGDIALDQTRSLVNQTSVREGDFFTFEIGRRSVRIDVDETDDFNDISRKIRVAAFGRVEVDVRDGENGQTLTISTIRGGESFTLVRGEDGRDALAGLGLRAGSFFPTDQLFADADADNEEEVLGGSFGFGIESPLSVSNRTVANFSLGELENAISTVSRAFRSLRPNPFASLLNNQQDIGPPPPATAARIANFQTALQRLQSGNPSTGLSLFT